jgi:hypothetical protein
MADDPGCAELHVLSHGQGLCRRRNLDGAYLGIVATGKGQDETGSQQPGKTKTVQHECLLEIPTPVRLDSSSSPGFPVAYRCNWNTVFGFSTFLFGIRMLPASRRMTAYPSVYGPARLNTFVCTGEESRP